MRVTEQTHQPLSAQCRYRCICISRTNNGDTRTTIHIDYSIIVLQCTLNMYKKLLEIDRGSTFLLMPNAQSQSINGNSDDTKRLTKQSVYLMVSRNRFLSYISSGMRLSIFFSEDARSSRTRSGSSGLNVWKSVTEITKTNLQFKLCIRLD